MLLYNRVLSTSSLANCLNPNLLLLDSVTLSLGGMNALNGSISELIGNLKNLGTSSLPENASVSSCYTRYFVVNYNISLRVLFHV
jgi:hypothetical protein